MRTKAFWHNGLRFRARSALDERRDGVFVEIFVIFSLNFSILFRWDNRLNTRIFRTFNNFVRIVAEIGQQNFTRQTFDQRNSFFTVSSWAISNNSSDLHTKRIHGQMKFCVEPLFVRPIPSLPPIAPAAYGWTLQWLASIINHSYGSLKYWIDDEYLSKIIQIKMDDPSLCRARCTKKLNFYIDMSYFFLLELITYEKLRKIYIVGNGNSTVRQLLWS